MKHRSISWLLYTFPLPIAVASCTYELPTVDPTLSGRGGSGGEASSSSGSTSNGGSGGQGGASGNSSSGNGPGGQTAASTSSSSSGTGGQGGEIDPNLCMTSCTDPNAGCVGNVCTCNSGYVDTDDGTVETATCESATTIVNVKLDVGVTHTRLGNLAFKLKGPQSQVFTVMLRPGWLEPEDNNTLAGTNLGPAITGPSGDQSDMVATHVIHFYDDATTDAEGMGRYLNGGTVAVCRDADTVFPEGSMTPVCDYRPNKGAAAGEATFAAAFGGFDATGMWTFCVGDANATAIGTLEYWALTITTLGGTMTQQSITNLALSIADDTYNGSLDSMVCHTLTIQ